MIKRKDISNRAVKTEEMRAEKPKKWHSDFAPYLLEPLQVPDLFTKEDADKVEERTKKDGK